MAFSLKDRKDILSLNFEFFSYESLAETQNKNNIKYVVTFQYLLDRQTDGQIIKQIEVWINSQTDEQIKRQIVQVDMFILFSIELEKSFLKFDDIRPINENIAENRPPR